MLYCAKVSQKTCDLRLKAVALVWILVLAQRRLICTEKVQQAIGWTGFPVWGLCQVHLTVEYYEEYTQKSARFNKQYHETCQKLQY